MTAAVKTDHLLQKLIKLHQMIKTYDEENANKLVELVNKLSNDKLYVAFAGHFSAGKSSMINKLLNEQILPTSPIPTSANLVLLEKGDHQVTLYSKAKESIELDGDYSIEQIKEYCKQGDEIERVSIKKPYQNLHENVVIMDTPGIDSTDAAHKLSTESMLHIADVIFYVTDYNHVQSEENLSFVKEMKEKEKMIFLIVNQIDKHVEKEVSFSVFKHQIETSFSDIGLHHQDIFFTTIMNDDHQHNQLHEIKEIIRAIVDQKEEYMEKNVEAAVACLLKEHLEKYKDLLELTDVDQSQVMAELAECQAKKAQINQKLENEENKIKELTAEINDRVSTLLKSANIIPYETREKAASYIEAADPAFKVGFLFSKAKTEQERDKRKKELVDELRKNVETQITWHFTPLFKEYLKKIDIHDESLLQEVQSFSIEVTEQNLADALKPGASLNNQYILTYSSDVSELIKKHSKHKAMKIMDKMIDHLKIDHHEECEKLSQEINKLMQEIVKHEAIILKCDQLNSYDESLKAILADQVKVYVDSKQWLLENLLYRHRVLKSLNIKETAQIRIADEETMLDVKDPIAKLSNKEQFIKETEEMIKRLKKIRGFKQFTDSLESKVNSYNNRSFTVALFGAFSAGKSSFANALIGDRLLPSSPTPTTATINKIAPTSAEKQHGLVEVKLKSEEMIINEVKESIPILNNKHTSIDELINQLHELEGKEQSEIDAIKKYRIALSDYQSLTNNGLLITSTKETFKDFVAKEEKACLVEEVIIYYDCPITRAGITLVDTPGADSLHKRHTAVAFQYIKKADAILYVTYYNHPFSKGDREFLRQLGRVKDSFTLDKMFFLINAIDLAKDEQEVELVKQYIKEQLLQQEIRNVRLFGVSSLNILSNNLEHEQDYLTFKEQFEYFIKQELTNTTIVSIKEDLKRSDERMTALIVAAENDAVEKEKIKQKLLDEKLKVEQELSKLTNTHLTTHTNQEIEELIFYVKQRLLFRFNDFFKEAFHPGVFTQSNIQQALLSCLNELIRTIEFELVQELQATTLRVEKFIQKGYDDEFSRISQLIKKKSQSITLTKPEMHEISTPDIGIEFSSEMVEKLKPSLKLFKNAKSFFEKNEKKAMSEDLAKRFDDPISITLEKYLEEFIRYYNEVIDRTHSSLVQEISVQTAEGFDALLDLEAVNSDQLKQEQSKLQATINLLKI
ncbi:dynamin family protein [uncultured Metabacillus sp.]|uniref:dynamin family protein n=1 Tax=uncultured Metabacillus sp. TaxID=2860135 RepID=UPI00262048F7|nr:dynamin family protein [uncultured Metabacillus sp.]